MPYEDYAHLFITPPRIRNHDDPYMRHKKEKVQKEWKKFWNSVEWTIKRNTERGWTEKEVWSALTSRDFSDYVALRKDFEYVNKG
jgi:hypothetical protein